MAKSRAISDEEIIAAIVQHRTFQEAAQAIGISVRTIYDRMEDRDFRSLYMSTKDEILRGAVFSINQKLSAAIDTIAGIMEDTSNNPAVRLQAAQTILKNAEKLADRLAAGEYNSRHEAKGLFDIEGF